jgi:hypothetical protein
MTWDLAPEWSLPKHGTSQRAAIGETGIELSSFCGGLTPRGICSDRTQSWNMKTSYRLRAQQFAGDQTNCLRPGH